MGADGRTPYHRVKGRPNHVIVAPFGEHVLWQPLKTDRGNRSNMVDQYESGVWVGVNNANGAYIVMTAEGVFQTRSIRRVMDTEKYPAGMLDISIGMPWDENGRLERAESRQ